MQNGTKIDMEGSLVSRVDRKTQFRGSLSLLDSSAGRDLLAAEERLGGSLRSRSRESAGKMWM